MDIGVDLWNKNKPFFEDVSQYKKLISKLIYLTGTRSDISYVVR